MSGANSGFVEGNGIANDLVNGHYNGAPPIDVFPAPGSALIDAGDPAYVLASDFNGTLRNGNVDAGAYAFDAAGNPGWALSPGFKVLVGSRKTPMPPTDVRTD